MNKQLKEKLIKISQEKTSGQDVSHDFIHAMQVLTHAENIAKKERADLDIIIPAALFHDIIVYPKNHPKRYDSQKDSAFLTEKVLKQINEFPKNKIEKIKNCILECSFSKNIMPKFLESKILQDADGLEATGAISIMRTYSSSGQMKRLFYDTKDPFCQHRKPTPSNFALDLFYARLLQIEKRMHTKTAKKIAKRRTAFLQNFLTELKLELQEKYD
jgi:uncharacterized protein